MTTLEFYLEEVNEYLIDHYQVADFRFVIERILANSAYIRVHVALIDGSLLQFTEYSEVDIDGDLQLITYSYQWMDADGTLLRRWDNAAHYPRLRGFPHHVHDGHEKKVVPSEPMSLIKVLDSIVTQLSE